MPTDAAKRLSDSTVTHFLVDPRGNVGRWAAYRLSDGGTDGVLYATPAEAVHHQLWWKQCAYVRIPTGGIGPKEAQLLLTYHRLVYDAGNTPPYLQGAFLRVPTTIDWMSSDTARRHVARYGNRLRRGR